MDLLDMALDVAERSYNSRPDPETFAMLAPLLIARELRELRRLLERSAAKEQVTVAARDEDQR